MKILPSLVRVPTLIGVLVMGLPVLSAFQAHAASPAPVYRLSELYQIALKEAEQIQLVRENVGVVDQDALKAKSGLIPKISSFAGYRLYSREQSVAGSIVQPQSAGNLGLRLDQAYTLNGKEFKRYEVATQAQEVARRDLDTTTETYLLSVAQSYFEVLRYQKTLDIAQATVERLEQYRAAVETRLKLEAVTKTDLLRAEAELSNARSDLVRARNVLALARSVLSRVVGISQPFEVYDHQPDPDEDLAPDYDVPFLISQALDRRSEVAAVKARIEAARLQIGIAKGGYWPNLALEGAWVHNAQEPDSPFMVEDSFYMGAQIQFPLYDGGFRQADLKQARMRNRQAVLELEDLKKRIRIEVEGAYLDLLTQQGVMTSLEDQLLFARDNYEAVVKQFSYGLSDSLNMLDANTLLQTSELRLSDARFKLAFAKVRLQRVTGQLWQTVQGQE